MFILCRFIKISLQGAARVSKRHQRNNSGKKTYARDDSLLNNIVSWSVYALVTRALFGVAFPSDSGKTIYSVPMTDAFARMTVVL